MVLDIEAANRNINHHTDILLPFQADKLNIRGRFIRLNNSITQVLNQHNYPLPVSKLLGEALLLVSLIGSGLKVRHKLTLQIKGDGVISTLVADYRSDNAIRGYAAFDAEKLNIWTGGNDDFKPFLLVGKGYLALTMDQGKDMKPYQGIVALDGETLSGAVLKYMEQSEQILSSIKIAINQQVRTGVRAVDGEFDHKDSTYWEGAAFLIQKLGKSGEDNKIILEDAEQEEEWNRARMLFKTINDNELLDTKLAAEKLIYNLYHDEDTRIFDMVNIKFGCSCSSERVKELLNSYDYKDLKSMVDEKGNLTADCQFCSVHYSFELSSFKSD